MGAALDSTDNRPGRGGGVGEDNELEFEEAEDENEEEAGSVFSVTEQSRLRETLEFVCKR